VRPALVDTSVWIRFFDGDEAVRPLSPLLERRMALVHAWVLGELSLGSGVPAAALSALDRAPRLATCSDDAMWRFLQANRLSRSGIGWVDVQLLAAAGARGVALWSVDTALVNAARALRLPKLDLEA
jgi:predicted nucleic acid-binding protein